VRDVTAQPFEALLLLHGGAVAGLCYLLLRLVRVRSGKRWVTHVCDAVFVLILAVLLPGYLFLANRGTVRGFLVAAFAIGFAACHGAFSPVFIRISQKIRKK
jgi:hypothetical protein